MIKEYKRIPTIFWILVKVTFSPKRVMYFLMSPDQFTKSKNLHTDYFLEYSNFAWQEIDGNETILKTAYKSNTVYMIKQHFSV